ncbi:MAG: glycosyltransferase family 2 protein [Deltaproteobacteria bacterium]|nr:glycosyltransferase family 2 protein [Deltaproteobacteria bacterium]
MPTALARRADPLSARIAVVIPAFNVGAHLEAVIRTVPDFVELVVVVDDASRDDTFEVARRTVDPRVHVLRHERNTGVGGAMKSGYKKALELGADIAVKMDGDGQMNPDHMPALIRPILLGHADYTKGNRFRDRAALRHMPLVRRVGNLGLSFLTKFAAGYWNVFDPTNGFTAIRREALEEIPFDSLADRYYFETSMLVWLNVLGAAVRDVPMPARYGEETSSLRVSHALFTFPFRLLASMVWRIWQKHFVADFTAVALFLLLGTPLVLFGAGFGATYWVRSIATGHATTAGQVMIAGLPLLVGIQLLLQAFVMEISSVPQMSSRGPLDGRAEAPTSPSRAE